MERCGAITQVACRVGSIKARKRWLRDQHLPDPWSNQSTNTFSGRKAAKNRAAELLRHRRNVAQPVANGSGVTFREQTGQQSLSERLEPLFAALFLKSEQQHINFDRASKLLVGPRSAGAG